MSVAQGGKARRVCAIVYNPLSACAPERLQEISLLLRSGDVIGMPGTRLKATFSTFATHAVRTQQLAKHVALHWGWRSAPFSNRAAGTSILVGGRFRRNNIRDTFSPPPSLQGRGGAVRLVQGSVDLLPVALYFAPPPPKAAKKRAWIKGTDILLEWVDKILCDAPLRTTPILLMDINDGLGGDSGKDETVGDFPDPRQGAAGTKLREL